ASSGSSCSSWAAATGSTSSALASGGSASPWASPSACPPPPRPAPTRPRSSASSPRSVTSPAWPGRPSSAGSPSRQACSTPCGCSRSCSSPPSPRLATCARREPRFRKRTRTASPRPAAKAAAFWLGGGFRPGQAAGSDRPAGSVVVVPVPVVRAGAGGGEGTDQLGRPLLPRHVQRGPLLVVEGLQVEAFGEQPGQEHLPVQVVQDVQQGEAANVTDARVEAGVQQ